MRLCPGGGGGGLFLDRVELPPGVSVEGGPDGGGAGGVIHKTHEVMRLPPEKVVLSTPNNPEGEDDEAWRGEEELKGCIFTFRDNLRRCINASKTRSCLNKYITEMFGRECKI